jgi:hypothetical protein
MNHYLNIPNLNDTLTDLSFQVLLPKLVDELYSYGFASLLEDYHLGLDPVTDWVKLRAYTIDTNHINAQCTVGLSIVKRHMPHIYDVKNDKGNCISGLWTRENIERVLIVNRRSHSTPYVSELIRQIGFMASASKVTIYRPVLAKRIVDYYQAREVLDVCVGWGGRMLGAACLEGVHYTGIEPCCKTFDALVAIQQTLTLENVTLYNDTAERVVPTLERKYDLAITSPPYYNLEIYSDEPSQSHHYGTYEKWVEHFLSPVLFGVLDKLKEDGVSCWSVKNFKTDRLYPLYDDIVELHKQRGWVVVESFFVGNSTRPGRKKGTSKEMTYVFRGAAPNAV